MTRQRRVRVNGFEWRYAAAGLGWGLAVGLASGVLVGCALVLVDASLTPSRSAGELLAGMFWASVIGAHFGVIGGSVSGALVGLVLSVLVGRQPRESLAVWLTSTVCVVVSPVLTWASLRVMGFGFADLGMHSLWDPWLWIVLGTPAALSALAMGWTARRLARRNAALARSPQEPLVRGSGPPAPAR